MIEEPSAPSAGLPSIRGGAPTVSDLANTGLTGVITGSLSAYEEGLADPTASGLPAFSTPPTLAELQAVINVVNTKIATATASATLPNSTRARIPMTPPTTTP